MLGIRKSFRLRIMALSVLLSGAVLVAFGLMTRFALFQLKVRSIDQSLRLAPIPEFPHPKEDRVWQRVSEMLDQFSGEVFGGNVSIFVYGVDETIFYQADSWPEIIDLDALPAAEGELLERVPRERRGGEFENLRGRFRPPNGRGPRRLRDPDFVQIRNGAQLVRVGVYEQPGYNIAIAVDLARVTSDLGNLRYAFFWALPVALVVLAGGSWFIATRAIKPVRTLTETARSVSAERLDKRIAKTSEDAEFSDLIDVFNEMLERLERSFVQATRFSADAAHELKTPLAILQGNIEAALQKTSEDPERQKEMALLLDETQRLKNITAKLLILSRADAGTLSANLETIQLKPLLEELIEDFEMDSPETRFHIDLEECSANTDQSFLIRIVQNLLSNAIKYSDPNNPEIWIRCQRVSNEIAVEVESSGELVEAGKREDLFDRFRRADHARNRSIDGLGLGLSLSREFARSMNAKLEWLESAESRNCFRLTLQSVQS